MVIHLSLAMANRHDTVALRGQFIGLHNAGFSISEISRQTGATRPTVRRWLRRFEESGVLTDLPRSGRPRATSAEGDERVLADVHNHHFTNATETTQRLQLDVSVSTTRRILHRNGIHHR